MLQGVAIDDILDLVISSLDEEPQDKYEETMGLPDYPLFRLFFQQAKMVLPGGKKYKTLIRVRKSNSFRFVRPYELTPKARNNVMAKAETPWAMNEVSQMYDTREEDFNGGPDQIASVVDEMESDMWEDLIDGMEAALCRAPNSATDDRAFRGLLYWFPRVAVGSEQPDFGFTGTTIEFGNGTTTTTCAEIDGSDAANERWRPGQGTYNRADNGLVRLVRAALRRSKFKLLPQLKGKPVKGAGERVLLAGQTLSESLEELMGNVDPSGKDPAKTTLEEGTLRGLRVQCVPRFDEEGLEDSLIGIDTGKTFGIQMKGRFLKRSTWKSDQNPNIVFDQIDSTCQVHCTNRRAGGFHLHKPRTAA